MDPWRQLSTSKLVGEVEERVRKNTQEAIKELRDRVDALTARVEALENPYVELTITYEP